MLVRDANGHVFQALHPLDGSLQTVAVNSGAPETTVGIVAAAFDEGTKAIAVKAVGSHVAHLRLGQDDAEAEATDFPLVAGDGWIFLSLQGAAADGGAKPRATHLSVCAEGGAVSVQVVEFN